MISDQLTVISNRVVCWPKSLFQYSDSGFSLITDHRSLFHDLRRSPALVVRPRQLRAAGAAAGRSQARPHDGRYCIGSAIRTRNSQSIHVAGSKGKGSTCAMLESVLRRAGYRTGLFTSPHLTMFVNGFRSNAS